MVAILAKRALRIERPEGKMHEGAKPASPESARSRRNWRDAREQWDRISFRSMPHAREPQTHESTFLGNEGVDRHPRAGHEPLRRQYLLRRADHCQRRPSDS